MVGSGDRSIYGGAGARWACRSGRAPGFPSRERITYIVTSHSEDYIHFKTNEPLASAHPILAADKIEVYEKGWKF